MIALAILMHQAAQEIVTPSAVTVAYVCTLRPYGTPFEKRDMNFGVLLSETDTNSNKKSFKVLETSDRQGLLRNAKIDSFQQSGEGLFVGLTGPTSDPKTLMLSLKYNDKGWYDTGIVRYGSYDAIHVGACFGLKTVDTTFDFHDVLSRSGANK